MLGELIDGGTLKPPPLPAAERFVDLQLSARGGSGIEFNI
jgi:hypothetical protein